MKHTIRSIVFFASDPGKLCVFRTRLLPPNSAQWLIWEPWGGSFSWAYAINDRGQVVGMSTTDNEETSYVPLAEWQNG